jgi:hypothetical protein
VFFDAAGIEWEYEPEGYDVGGVWYLPDFRLPQLNAFVEIKPTDEAAEGARQVVFNLAKATGHKGLAIAGYPSIENPPRMTETVTMIDRVDRAVSAFWMQCPFCDAVTLDFDFVCHCVPDSIDLYHDDWSADTHPRVRHAMLQAQQARFEHGEDGRPAPYPDANLAETSVRVVSAEPDLEDWLANAGLTIAHGGEFANVLFAWIDEENAHGMFKAHGVFNEISKARTRNKPVFVGFNTATQLLWRDSMMIDLKPVDDLATLFIMANTVWDAAKFFVQWLTRNAPRPDAIYEDLSKTW